MEHNIQKIKKYFFILIICASIHLTRPAIAQQQNRTIVFKGKITDGETYQGLYNIKVKYYLISNGVIVDSIITYTNHDGEYITNQIPLSVEKTEGETNISEIRYYGNKIFTDDNYTKTLKIYDITGQQVKTITTDNKEIEINLQGIASGTYLSVLETENKIYTNLLVNNNGTIIGYKKRSEITKHKNILGKTKSYTINQFIIELRDPTSAHYHQLKLNNEEIWGPRNIPEGIDTIQYDVPLLTRLNITPFNNPDYPHIAWTLPTINNTKELFLWSQGADLIPGIVFFPIKHPIRIYLNKDYNFPTGYDTTQINEAFNYITTQVSKPEHWKQEWEPINNGLFENMGVNIVFINDTTNPYEFGLAVYRKESQTNLDSLTGFDMRINLARITPPILRKRVQYAMQMINAGRGPPYTRFKIPYTNAHSNNIYDPNVIEFNREEKIIFNYITQLTKPQVYAVDPYGPLFKNNTKPVGKLIESYWLTENGEWVSGKVEYKER